jgi:CBS domain-containing protein
MEIVGVASKVTIYIGDSDRRGQKPLYLAILELLKREDCAGATVTRGVAGFGAHSRRIRTATIVDLSSDLPLIIEWVDHPARVSRVLPMIVEIVPEGLITRQEVEVVSYSHRDLRALPAAAPVSDVMTREVQSITPDAAIAQAIELLIGKRYRALPVVDAEQRVVGILTDGDVLRRLELPEAGVQAALTEAELTAQLNALRSSGLLVADLMRTQLIVVTPETLVAEAVRLMTEHGIKRLPVVDGSGRLAGMVSRVDVLRALSQPGAGELPRRAAPTGHNVTVRDIMTSDVPTVQADMPLNNAVDQLLSTAQRRVVVVDRQRRVLGIITDGDLINRASATERPGLLQKLAGRLGRDSAIGLAKRSAAEVMTPHPITVTPDTPLLEALRLLLQHGIKRLPVVDDDGALVGMVGRGSIMQSLAQELEEEQL